jgi:hypothetical protein
VAITDGQATGLGWSDARLRFDHSDPGKTIDLAVAERMLMDWRARNPGQFGYWLALALTGAAPSRTARTARPG